MWLASRHFVQPPLSLQPNAHLQKLPECRCCAAEKPCVETRARGALNGYYLPNCCAKLPVGAECRSSGPPVICQAHKKRRWGGQPGVTLSRSFSWLHGQHASSPPEISVSRSLQPEESIFMPPPLTPASFLPLRARTDYRASPCTRQVPAAVKKKEEGGEATNNFFFLQILPREESA